MSLIAPKKKTVVRKGKGNPDEKVDEGSFYVKLDADSKIDRLWIYLKDKWKNI